VAHIKASGVEFYSVTGGFLGVFLSDSLFVGDSFWTDFFGGPGVNFYSDMGTLNKLNKGTGPLWGGGVF